MSARLRQRIVALTMASVYALLALAGQGLHELTHGADGCCSDGARCQVAEATCGCGSEHCPTAKAQAEKDADHTHTAFRGPESEGHDPHTCSVCRLLAQLKVGHGPAPVATTSSAAVADFVLSIPSAVASTERSTLGARGPPVIG